MIFFYGLAHTLSHVRFKNCLASHFHFAIHSFIWSLILPLLVLFLFSSSSTFFGFHSFIHLYSVESVSENWLIIRTYLAYYTCTYLYTLFIVVMISQIGFDVEEHSNILKTYTIRKTFYGKL